ncbi:hypothetical protein [Clostridium chauvoei]|uniref:Co-chaperone DjlA N-terminal domain-containing protein n=2 Tax=Clostridium chauvoei TaxID=46867 RepID=S6EUY5_9CLOT|nr:hypothetical protein [Clostridium chauvoei]ATD53998.1 hypothetical protein BTM20_01470 [Clostridium chauvoei]ATD58204.1 hypothetical protein BTM21_10850 [Clostridium chauvoei]MBX7280645.1 hypothetical protein [Clostridium chauvoei]MBX7283027.1 hypothetical protein [Clostridium chauvoei]MBX7285443.1 hypothetical protein [Clostridium chauvoei]
MFLNELNKELAIAYINLLIEFALVDDKVEEKERELIERSLKEMNLEKLNLSQIKREETIKLIKDAGERVKNIVFFELTRVALSDAEYEIDEVDFLDELALEFNISRAKRFQMANYFFKHSEYDEVNEEIARKEAEEFLD